MSVQSVSRRDYIYVFNVLMEDGHFLQRAGGERHSADLFPRSLESSRDVSHYSFCPYNFDVLCFVCPIPLVHP